MGLQMSWQCKLIKTNTYLYAFITKLMGSFYPFAPIWIFVVVFYILICFY